MTRDDRIHKALLELRARPEGRRGPFVITDEMIDAQLGVYEAGADVAELLGEPVVLRALYVPAKGAGANTLLDALRYDTFMLEQQVPEPDFKFKFRKLRRIVGTELVLGLILGSAAFFYFKFWSF